MPKIINHTNSALDSLNAKLNVLENQFTALEKKQIILQDSIQSLNQTIIRADIKTNFFTDQLAFQLFVFSCILILLSFFSWKYILDPFRKKLEIIEKTTLPESIAAINELLNEEMEKVKALNEKTVRSAGNATSWGYRSMMIHCASVPGSKYNVLIYGLAQMSNELFVLKKTNYTGNAYISTLEYIYSLMQQDDFEYNKFSSKALLKCNRTLIRLIAVDNSKISELAFSIKGLLSSKTTSNITPTTAIEAEASGAQ